MKTVNERLRDLREDSDLSQAQVGAILGITQQHYSEYERGKYQMPLHHLITLAKHYRVSMDYLLGLIDEEDSDAKDMIVTRSCTSGDLIRRVLSLNEKGRRAVVECVSLLELKYKAP